MIVSVVGLDAQAAPVSVREKLAFPRNRLGDAYARLRSCFPEAVILFTCNRTEIYVVSLEGQDVLDEVTQFLASFQGVGILAFSRYLYLHRGMEAVGHLFAVASGLDSAILGEPQILGQVSEALEQALAEHGAGPVLAQLFRHAISVGKRARAETAISKNAGTVSSAAVELSRRFYPDLGRCSALVIGTGEMSELAARSLADHGVQHIAVASRSQQKAEALARLCGGTALAFWELDQVLDKCDLVISATSAPGYILRKSLIGQAMVRRRGRSLLLIDIAVPRDIEPEAGTLDGVRLYDIDDLRDTVGANLREREKEIPRVGEIIAQELPRFQAWLASLEAVPTIAAFRERAEAIRQQEFQRVLPKLAHLSERDLNLVNALSQAIVGKLLHAPTVRLKELAREGNGQAYASTLRELFDLEQGSP